MNDQLGQGQYAAQIAQARQGVGGGAALRGPLAKFPGAGPGPNPDQQGGARIQPISPPGQQPEGVGQQPMQGMPQQQQPGQMQQRLQQGVQQFGQQAARVWDADPTNNEFIERIGQAIAHPQLSKHPQYEQFRQQMWAMIQNFLQSYRTMGASQQMPPGAQPQQPPPGGM